MDQSLSRAKALELAKSAVIWSKIEVLSNTQHSTEALQKHLQKHFAKAFCKSIPRDFSIFQSILNNSGVLKISPLQCLCNASIGLERHFASPSCQELVEEAAVLYESRVEFQYMHTLSYCNNMIRMRAARCICLMLKPLEVSKPPPAPR